MVDEAQLPVLLWLMRLDRARISGLLVAQAIQRERAS